MNDVPVVGGERASEQVGEPHRPPAAFAVGIALGAVALLWSIGGGSAPAPDELPAFPTTVTTIAPPPRLVDQTLEWTPTRGLDDLIAAYSMVGLDRSGTLLVGRDSAGMTVYRTTDGIDWEPSITLAENVGRFSSAVSATVDGTALVAVNRAGGGGTLQDPWLWASADDVLWSGGPLPKIGPEWGGAEVQSIVSFKDEILITGYSQPGPDESLTADLPADVKAVLEAGGGWLEIEGRDQLTVRIFPGLVVYSRSMSSDEIAEHSGGNRPVGAVAWRGTSTDSLTAASWDDSILVRGVLADGRLVGWSEGDLVLSDDGRTRSRVIRGIHPGWNATVWEGGIVSAADDSRSIVKWDPDSGEVATLASTTVLGGRSVRTLDASASGIAATLGGIFTLLSEPTVMPLVKQGDVELMVTSAMNLILRRRGEDVASVGVMEAVASMEEGQVLISLDGERLEMSMDTWLEAIEATSQPIWEDLTVAHSPDGIIWSVQEWERMTGVGVETPAVFSAEDFVLAVDQGSGGGIAGAWVGHPIR